MKKKLTKKKKILTPAQRRDRERRREREAANEANRTLTTSKAIKQFCIQCSGGSRSEAARCVVIACPLWHYRTVNARRENLIILAERKEE